MVLKFPALVILVYLFYYMILFNNELNGRAYSVRINILYMVYKYNYIYVFRIYFLDILSVYRVYIEDVYSQKHSTENSHDNADGGGMAVSTRPKCVRKQTHTYRVDGVVLFLRLNIHINSRKRPNYPKHHTPKFVCILNWWENGKRKWKRKIVPKTIYLNANKINPLFKMNANRSVFYGRQFDTE